MCRQKTERTKEQEKLRWYNERIDHARENRNKEMTNIVHKAQMENQTVEDIKYIQKMTTNNLKLDINNKLNETEVRRNQLVKEQMRKLEELKLKEEEALKRRTYMKNQILKSLQEKEHKGQMVKDRR